MPVKDLLHDVFIRALVNAGWTILDEHVLYRLPPYRVWPDIEAGKNGVNILIEVKSFNNRNTLIEDFAQAVGKYMVYQAVLDYQQDNIPLYLAIPTHAYHSIFTHPVGQQVIDKIECKLIVFDVVNEEITLWID